ncbi:MAG TPA: anthranilate phosphoribosyltransferase, partial [Burkholderiales bacterium]|nr:anthranilate phosphoribosyltransferase [Burkholderiales bacterium]
EVLKLLGSRHVLVVHGMDGLDEISISDETFAAELKDGQILEYRLEPEGFGMHRSPIESIRVGDPIEAKRLLLDALENREGPARDVVILNAGASIYIAGLAESIAEGVEKAAGQIASGAARRKLEELVSFSNSLKAG